MKAERCVSVCVRYKKVNPEPCLWSVCPLPLSNIASPTAKRFRLDKLWHPTELIQIRNIGENRESSSPKSNESIGFLGAEGFFI